MRERVSIQATGNNAIESAKEKLEPYLEKSDRISELEIEFVVEPEETEHQEESEDNQEDDNKHKKERSLHKVAPDTQMFEILKLVRDNPHSSVKELAEASDKFDRSNISPAMTKLYRHMLVEREQRGRTHHYTINAYGKANIEEHT